MADMTFKAKLLPFADLNDSYTLGSSSKRWKIFGDLTGTLNGYYTASTDNPVLAVRANNVDVPLFQLGHATSATGTFSNHYRLVYKGTGSSPNNYLQLIANTSSTDTIAMQVNENGNVSFTNTVSASISGNAATATKLATARSLKTKLDSTTAVTFDGSADQNAIPVTGTLGAANGGTGKTSLQDAANALINALSTGSSTPVDADYYVSQYVSGGTTTTTYHRRPMSALYTYIQGKTDTRYVKKTGDTMTGDLTVQGGTSSSAARINLNRYDGSVTGFVGYSKDSTKYGLYIAGTSPVTGYLTYIDTSSGRVYYRDSYNTNSVSLAYSQSGLAYADYSWLAGWNGYELRAVAKTQFAQASHTHSYLPLSGGTMTGWITFDAEQGIYARIKRKKADGGGWAYAPYRFIGNDNNTFASIGVYGSADTLGYIYIGAGDWNSTVNLRITPAGIVSATKVRGAVFNDYAEYRQVDDPLKPGSCVHEVGDGSMIMTTQRLQRGCKIISDTYGFDIGETEICNTPIAVSGRVLAYIYEGREEARKHIGYPVCSGPNGTISIMTDEEEEKYPSRIVGTISEIPDYDVWGSDNIKVDGRIWIYVR